MLGEASTTEIVKTKDARGFKNIEGGLKKIGFNLDEINGILGNNWYNFYKGIS